MLANAGHLQSLINPPGSPKSFFFAAPANVEDPANGPDGRSPRARTAAGGRIGGHGSRPASGELVDAPAKLGSRKHKPLGAAPGEYVHVK